MKQATEKMRATQKLVDELQSSKSMHLELNNSHSYNKELMQQSGNVNNFFCTFNILYLGFQYFTIAILNSLTLNKKFLKINSSFKFSSYYVYS